MTNEELMKIFSFHPATSVTGPKHDQVRTIMLGVAEQLSQVVPASEERKLAIRSLQQAMMFANAAIAIHTPATGVVINKEGQAWVIVGPSPRHITPGIRTTVTIGEAPIRYEGVTSEPIEAGALIEYNPASGVFRNHRVGTV